jgi:hypothetical protein
MGRADKMSRLRGRQGPRQGERFSLIPDDVLRSTAWGTLAGMPAKVLVVLAAQFNGYNNGRLTLPLSAARIYGIRSNDTLNRALHELRELGLIELTEQGGLPPYGCSRYALCWRDINCPPNSPTILRPTGEGWITWSEAPEKQRKRKPPNRSMAAAKSSPANGASWSGHKTT